MKTDGGGWTVFQRRQDGSVDFHRNWQDYKTGFGNLYGEFWLGNDYLHRQTARTASTLRIDMENWRQTTMHAEYDIFRIGDESDKYRMKVGNYSGTAGDSLRSGWIDLNDIFFSTKDRDNDLWHNNCADLYTGGWWFNNCHICNLNGKYIPKKTTAKGVRWGSWTNVSLKKAQMKIRPNSF